MNNYINLTRNANRYLIDISDLKLLCSDRITRKDTECKDFYCILQLLDSINNAVRTADNEENTLEDGEIITNEIDTDKIDSIFSDYYKEVEKKNKQINKENNKAGVENE